MKTIVLGLDGATWDRIVPAAAEGGLPGFARLMREGTWGPLRSTIPADSPSAWTSFATGMNPGRHGVFGFMARRPGAYEYAIGSSLLIRERTLWERASAGGLRVGVINVPFTYPPKPVNGFLVAGMMTPDLQSPFTHPPGLRDELLRAIPRYSISHGLGRTRGVDPRAVLAKNFAATITAREHAMRWLDERFAPDLLICVFTVLDRLQHFLWADGDPRHPGHDPSAPNEYREAIAAAYRQLDGVIERTLQQAGDDTLVVVLSDHGFEAVARAFYVNAWLAERGWLVLTGRRTEPAAWSNRAARLARRVLRVLPGCEGLRERLRARQTVSRTFLSAIDWKRTRAWFGLDRGLWLNVEGRDPLGTIKTGEEYETLRSLLVAELDELKDPETGYRMVAKVHRREELFHGTALAEAPDLVIEPARVAGDVRGCYVLSERLGFQGAGRFAGPSAPISGYHAPEGILLLRGRGISPGARLDNARIMDVAPTILRAMGLPGEEEMDGEALADFGAGRGKTGERLRGSTPPSSVSEQEPRISENEQREIERQLKDLGYLD